MPKYLVDVSQAPYGLFHQDHHVVEADGCEAAASTVFARRMTPATYVLDRREQDHPTQYSEVYAVLDKPRPSFTEAQQEEAADWEADHNGGLLQVFGPLA